MFFCRKDIRTVSVRITFTIKPGTQFKHFAAQSTASQWLPLINSWNIQSICFVFYLLGTLSTHAILKGVGVGSDVVNPLSATVTWVKHIIYSWLSFSSKFYLQIDFRCSKMEPVTLEKFFLPGGKGNGLFPFRNSLIFIIWLISVVDLNWTSTRRNGEFERIF